MMRHLLSLGCGGIGDGVYPIWSTSAVGATLNGLDVCPFSSYLWKNQLALPGFKVVTLTDAAANRVKDIIGKADRPIVGVRVGVKNGGCAGMSYTMEYAESVNPLDEVVEDKGVTVLIDPKAVLFLLGTEMDFQTTKMSSQFVFNNPNQTSACGCGESVAITPATPAALQSAN